MFVYFVHVFISPDVTVFICIFISVRFLNNRKGIYLFWWHIIGEKVCSSNPEFLTMVPGHMHCKNYETNYMRQS